MMIMTVPAAAAPVSLDLEHATAEERVSWAIETFGDGLVLTTSFGIQSAVMLHLVTRIAPKIPVIFIDTGYLFPETYRFARELTERLQLNLKKFTPAMTATEQEALHGKLWEQGLDGLNRYNLINKIEPMDRAVRAAGRDCVAGRFTSQPGEHTRVVARRAIAE